MILVALFLEKRFLLLTDVHNVWTPRIESACRWRMKKIWGLSGYRAEPYLFTFDTRKSFDEPLRVGMKGILEDRYGVAIFNNLASIHDRNLVARFGNY
jgi:hypothetical protein